MGERNRGERGDRYDRHRNRGRGECRTGAKVSGMFFGVFLGEGLSNAIFFVGFPYHRKPDTGTPSHAVPGGGHPSATSFSNELQQRAHLVDLSHFQHVRNKINLATAGWGEAVVVHPHVERIRVFI